MKTGWPLLVDAFVSLDAWGPGLVYRRGASARFVFFNCSAATPGSGPVLPGGAWEGYP